MALCLLPGTSPAFRIGYDQIASSKLNRFWVSNRDRRMAGQLSPAVAPHAWWSPSGLSGGVMPHSCSVAPGRRTLPVTSRPASRRDGTPRGANDRRSLPLPKVSVKRKCGSPAKCDRTSTFRRVEPCQETVRPLFFSLAPLREKREKAKLPAGLDPGGRNAYMSVGLGRRADPTI